MSIFDSRRVVRESYVLVDSIVPLTAHAAFDKAAAYLKIKCHSIPVDPITRQADLRRVRRAMLVSILWLWSRVSKLVSSPETLILSWLILYPCLSLFF